MLSNGRMPDEDMKVIFNEWRHDVGTWMRPSTLKTYNALMDNGRQGDAQSLGKLTFSTYQFHLSGCKFLIDVFIRLPLVCIQPSRHLLIGRLLTELMTAFQEHKKTQQYVDVVARSLDFQQKQWRLGKQIWWVEYHHTQGQKLSFQVRDGTTSYYSLSDAEEEQVENFDCRRS